MARSLDQIISELNSTYNPQIDLIRKQQEAIPGQIAQQTQGLQAQQGQAFGDILGGARQRGLGFSGIPLSEQAKYTSTHFLPALANLQQQGNQQAYGLEQSILGINERRNTLAQQVRDQEIQREQQQRAFEEQQRQFNENLAFQKVQAERAARDAAVARQAAATQRSGSIATPTFGGGQPTQQPQPLSNAQRAYNDVKTRVSGQNDAQIASDFGATLRSANYGNAVDKIKIDLYRQLRPDLFTSPGKNYAQFSKYWDWAQ